MDSPSKFEHCSPGERSFNDAYLRNLGDYQSAVEAKHHGSCPARGFHYKTLAAARATYRSAENLPDDLCIGLGAVTKPLPALVRFSSGQSFAQADYIPDIRGFAVKVLDICGEPLTGCPRGVQDLLSVNANNHSIRNGEIFARLSLTASSPLDAMRTARKILSLREQLRLGWEFSRLALRTSNPLSSSAYFGTGPILFGSLPAKFRWVPVRPPRKRWPGLLRDGQRRQFCRDLMTQGLEFDLQIQTYVDDRVTPVEDLSVKWDEQRSPPLKVGTLRLNRIPSPASLDKDCLDVDDLAFSPWNGLEVHRPLGNLQRLRRNAYRQSAERRGARPRP